MQNPPQFSGPAQEAIELYLNTRKSLFITGKAGTGKSTLLEAIRGYKMPDTVVLAPTGVAALNVQGETIHSFFKLKPGYELDEAKNVRVSPRMQKAFASLDTILIDEISMVRADILDAIDVLLKRCRNSNEAFGGVRIILFGDLYQLPPVIKDEQKDAFLQQFKSPYFFDAHVFEPADLFSEPFELHRVELTEVFRQTERQFIDALNAIREGNVAEEHLAVINGRVDQVFIPEKDEQCIYLMTTNYAVNRLNQAELNKITAPEWHYKAVRQGNIGAIQPNEEAITVKKGAQIMFITNHPEKRWVNGSLGTIIDQEEIIDEESGQPIKGLRIKMDNGQEELVTPYTWEISKYMFKNGRFRREALGFFTQLPLRLAWAVTIHKSQGKTFDKVIIDLNKGSFAHGQTYVALSRCRSLQGTVLRKPVNHSDIIVDTQITEYMTH